MKVTKVTIETVEVSMEDMRVMHNEYPFSEQTWEEEVSDVIKHLSYDEYDILEHPNPKIKVFTDIDYTFDELRQISNLISGHKEDARD